MSGLKRPASLRTPARVPVVVQEPVAIGLTAACLLAVGSSLAVAQSSGGTTGAGGAAPLPPLTVEAPAKKKAAAKRPPAKASPAAAASQDAGASSANAGAPPTPAAVPGSNPYGDPNAPYKVDRSANTKLTEPILDTPRTITTIPKEVMQDKAATSIRELARTVPGVTLGTGEGGNPFGDRLFIRGFDARNDAYINGIRDSGVPIRENFNTEQVEILKGPSATIGGRGTSGGAVNLVTKQAADENFAIGTGTIGTDGTQRTTLDFNRVLSSTFSLRANGMWQNADVAGRDEVFDDRWGGSLAIAWKPTQTFKLTADYYHIQLNQLPDWGVPWDSVNRRPFTDSGVDRNNYYGYPQRDFQKSQQDVVTTTAEWKLSNDVTLSSRFRYGVSLIDYIAASPGNTTRTGSFENWTVASTPKSRWQETTTTANQTDLTSLFNLFGTDHTLVTGFEISREALTRDSYTGLASEAFGPNPGNNNNVVLNLLDPQSGLIPFHGSPTLLRRPVELTVDSRSLYALDTIKLSEQWILTAGIRWDSYSLDYSAVNASGPNTVLSRDDNLINYSAGITYKPVPNGSIYVAYGTSSNPVGAEVDGNGQAYGGIASNNALLDPEKNTSLEAGTKWEVFQRHLLLTAAVFETEKSNAREAVGNFVYSSGTYRIRGIDLGFAGKIGSALSIYGGAVFMDSEVLESRTLADIGQKFANIAHRSFNVLAKYELTNWLTVGGQATYRSEIFGGTIGSNGNRVDGFWRFDALADIKFDERYSLHLQGINLTDEVYYDALYRSGTPFVYIAPGRAFYATLKVRY